MQTMIFDPSVAKISQFDGCLSSNWPWLAKQVSLPMEEKRPRWAGRPSKPVGAAQRPWVGSTPALFRQLPYVGQ